MPTYDYVCPKGHNHESRQGIDITIMPCLTCGKPAKRQAIYQDQCIRGDTVARSIPLNERRYGRKIALCQEAGQEIEHAAEKAGVKTQNLYKKAIRRANRIKAGLEAPLRK
jgi:ribosomal protein L37AE/L43A